MQKDEFSNLNTASVLLVKIGNGSADADFARAIHKAVDRVMDTEKPAKVILTVEVVQQKKTGALVLSASVEAKLPKLSPPATQMHVGPKGELLNQMEFLMGGGPSEAPSKPLQISTSNQGSARLTVAKAPTPAPIAPAPALTPIVTGKDAAAGKEA